MPELPEVETVRRGLQPVLEGQRIRRILVRRSDLRRPVPSDFAVQLQGRRIGHVGRRGKYIIVACEGDLALLIHLGMSGRIIIQEPGKARMPGRFAWDQPCSDVHDHIEIETESAVRLIYSDPRRFGMMTVTALSGLSDHPLLKDLGPEPLEPRFTARMLAERLAGRTAPLKAALLDQRTVAGLGNIYVCEALFRARLSPERLSGSLSRRDCTRLVGAIRSVLNEAIDAGGSSLRDYTQADGTQGRFQHAFQVYDREGNRCSRPRCGATIRRTVQANRSSFFCPRCQR